MGHSLNNVKLYETLYFRLMFASVLSPITTKFLQTWLRAYIIRSFLYCNNKDLIFMKIIYTLQQFKINHTFSDLLLKMNKNHRVVLYHNVGW